MVAMGDKVNLFDWKLTQKECERIKEFYREFQQDGRFKYIIFDGQHEFEKDDEGLDFFLNGLR